jgi:LPLT family lysophospholipid transporter-like MFS transporter
MFALFYVVLAPFVGAFADALPKGKVMFISNAIKVVGCLMMLFGSHPLLAYAVVGLGAAAYSPAKYGILTELLPPSQLVKANGWIEGLTIASIILGVLLGGQLVGPHLAPMLLASTCRVDTGIDTGARGRHRRPDLPVYVHRGCAQPAHPAHRREPCARCRALLALLRDFWRCNNAPVARQAGADLAGHHHAVLGRVGQPALHRAGLGRGRAGLQHHAGGGLVGVVAWARPWARWWPRCACGWTAPRR